MAKFPQNDFKVVWRPFQLNPDASKEGVNKRQMYKEKFGEARIQAMLPRMVQTFEKIGVKYSLGGNTGNTMTSHRLLQWAGSVGAKQQNDLVEELFRNYFEEEKFLGDRAVLLAAVEKAGLDATEGAKIVDDESLWRSEVDADKKKYVRGVTGVPFFIFDGQFAISGGQPPEAFAEAIQEVASA
uniref:DSBA-like thioredoxin domain-containing protein n=1 Tax=Hemiselmis andersenii TaxID=464988 RepID=A0A6U5CD73_HEMAN|mmetsp:Transcript_39321/g.91925  ORF Transcript_39321/g.91925 Transcript_39321/m.91925 type:complete len:184 (+) Transcript_39321:318-869(+)